MHTITASQWERIGRRSHQGIVVPLFSLRGKQRSGIGEFLDLIPLIDWCKTAGLDVLQLLSLNHAETEPSPYNCISSCALNAAYLSLHALPFSDHCPLYPHTDRVDHAQVSHFKMSWLLSYAETQGKQLLQEPAAHQFIEDNPWLKPYALFRVLKQKEKTSWRLWPSIPKQELYTRYAEEIAFHCLVQYLCFQQLSTVRAHARSVGVLLMGDLPILMNPESADVWEHPTYFDLHLSVGAPPDAYNTEGQNWGFPPFNWDAVSQDQMHWWKQRLRYAESFFDLFRIDHVLGFFRFFTIPPHHPAKEGRFVPADDETCQLQGMRLLTAIASATAMLPLAEDLGTPLPCVRATLEQLGICGTKVMRWEQDTLPIDYPPLSLTCVSTHDSETLALWWQRYPEEATRCAQDRGWDYHPHLNNAQREHLLRESHQSGSLFHINPLQEYLACFPELVHPQLEDEQINIPGTCSPHNWSYRFVPSVEEIISHPGLLDLMRRVLH